VGGHEEIEVDVRVVSATLRDLRSAVNAGSFRLDLYYRLAAVLLRTPSLRERPEDIPPLLEQFLRDAGHTGPVSDVFPEASLSELLRHAWPGNVRELRNVVLGTLALGAEQNIVATDTPLHQASVAQPFERLFGMSYRDARRALLDEFELSYVESLLSRSKGNVRQAARLGRMDRSYLMELIRRHRLRP
jgi:DNA-binding NtrC family response regulator